MCKFGGCGAALLRKLHQSASRKMEWVCRSGRLLGDGTPSFFSLFFLPFSSFSLPFSPLFSPFVHLFSLFSTSICSISQTVSRTVSGMPGIERSRKTDIILTIYRTVTTQGRGSTKTKNNFRSVISPQSSIASGQALLQLIDLVKLGQDRVLVTLPHLRGPNSVDESKLRQSR